MTSDGSRFLVQPRVHPLGILTAPFSRFPLPAVPTPLIDDCCRALRHVWRRSRRCAAYLLYLELGSHQWQARMPPQLCGPDAMRLNASFPRCPVPGHGLRLAGSIACGPDGEEALPVLSAFDGLHLVVYPEEHGALAAWVTIGGWTLPVCVRDVTWDPPLPQDTEAMLAH